MNTKELALKELTEIEARQKELRRIIEESDKPKSIFDRVKNFEDILKESTTSEDFKRLLNYNGTCIDMLTAKYSAICAKIIEVINEGWTADYGNDNEAKWRIWWRWNVGLSAFVFDNTINGFLDCVYVWRLPLCY